MIVRLNTRCAVVGYAHDIRERDRERIMKTHTTRRYRTRSMMFQINVSRFVSIVTDT